MGLDEHELSASGVPAPTARASDRDRDRTLELLSTAASDGRLTLEEYSARADRVLGARTLSELGRLTSDLQQGAELPAQMPQKLSAILSSESRKGRWTVPARLTARSLLGDCHIELQNAVLTSHVTTIEATALLGSVTIFVPDGVEVRLSGRSVLGSRSANVRSAAPRRAPVIDVKATAFLGSVTVRTPTLASRVRDTLSRVRGPQ
jgi:hypothetical protein